MTSIKLKALLAILLVVGLLLVPSPQPVEAQGWLDGWDKRVEFTIDHDDIDSPLDWFPVRVHISASTGIPIDIGDAASDRGGIFVAATYINKGNPANATGIITSVEIYAVSGNNLADCEVGTFYTTNGDTLKCRDTETIGAVTSGSKQTFSGLSLSVQAGDYIGIYFSSGQIEADGTGYSGVWFKSGDHCTTDDESTYTPFAGDAISVYGTGVVDVSCVFDEVGANSKKIAITKDDGTTELYGEIENWDATNETADVWTSRNGWNISNTTDTTGFLYYDNDHADNDAYIGIKNSTPAQSVWDANFVAVYHMVDGANTSSIYDSTSNNNDGTKKGAAEPAVTTSGKIADAQDFDGSDDYINIGDIDLNHMTISAWAYRDNTNDFHVIVAKDAGEGVATDRNYWIGGRSGANTSLVSIHDSSDNNYQIISVADALPLSTWTRVTLTFDGANLRLYINGAEDGNSPVAANITPATNNADAGIGRDIINSQREWVGLLDEIRISTDRSAAWDKASYESERDDLITWGSEETRERSWGYIIG